MTIQHAKVYWEWKSSQGTVNGGLEVYDDGRLYLGPDDGYYSGTLTREDTIDLALKILAVTGHVPTVDEILNRRPSLPPPTPR